VDKHEKEAVEKMKFGAMQGIPGEPIGEEEVSSEDQAIVLPPPQRILTMKDGGETIERHHISPVPAGEIAKVVFALSTGQDADPSGLSVRQGRLLLDQLTALNQIIERQSGALRVAEGVLFRLRSGGVVQAEVVDAMAAIKAARP